MTELVLLIVAASPALFFLALPFLGSTVLAVVAAVVQRRLKADASLDQAAGEWLATLVEQRGLPVRVAVSAEITGSMDGYWPRAAIIGLSPRTWIDRSLAGRAIASHELGHAELWAYHPTTAKLLASARQVYGAASLLAGSAFLVGALMDSVVAVVIGFIALFAAIVGGVGVLVDEALASRAGAQTLQSVGLRTLGTDLSMAMAAAIYALPVVLYSAFLMNGSAFAEHLLASSLLRTTNSDLGLWSVLFLAPILALRAAHVVLDGLDPSPTPMEEFRLNWNLFQERSWEFHSSVIVLLWLGLTYDEPVSAGLAPLFVLGALPAMTTLGAIGRLAVVMPLVTLLALSGFYGPPSTTRSPRYPAPVAATDLMAPQAGLATRVLGLVRIAWTPLLLVLVVRAIQGW